MAAIEIQGLSKRFGDVVAVDDLSFRAREGAVTGFLGPNGAGKSTTLRMLLGLVTPDEGTATIGGERYAELAEPFRHVGAVLEADCLPSRPAGARPPPRAGRRRRAAAQPRRRRARRGRPRRRRPAPREGLLARDAAAPRSRERAARRAGGADPRRAGQRPRPGGRPLAAAVRALVRRSRRHRARVEPRAGRGRPDRRRRRDHRERTSRHPVLARRAGHTVAVGRAGADAAGGERCGTRSQIRASPPSSSPRMRSSRWRAPPRRSVSPPPAPAPSSTR